ncbi:MAG TPA: branched-chain amino acid ABC transporter permease [Arachnia sp.]|nr:branched-chain amino acid ABC transporter permease [Arachnia sp.]HMT86495.1 branched-chain amino acid ABC transporter permease [Arachnia sp.]
MRLPLLWLLLAVLLVSALARPAHADDDRAMQTEPCVPSPTVGCLAGTLAGAGEGVVVLADGPAGALGATTNDAGRWSIAVDQAGDYAVEVDADTLPDALALRDAAPQTRTVALGSNTAVLIPLDATAEEGAPTPEVVAPGFDWQRLLQQAASGLRLGLLLALAAVGLSLIYGTTGISNFAHGEMVTLGGLLGYAFANLLGFPLWLATVVVVVLCGGFGYLQDVVVWRPLRKRNFRVTQLMIVTIGMSLALQYTYQFFIGASTVRIVTANPVPVRIGPVTLTEHSLVAMVVSTVILLAVGFFLRRTRLGRAARAVSDNPALAAASGIRVGSVVRLIWIASAALAGLSGVLLGLVLNGINWMTGMQLLLLLFSAVTLGGLGTAFGALVGALVIGMTVELTNIWLPGDFKYATALLLMIVILLVRPQGIFGRKERVG